MSSPAAGARALAAVAVVQVLRDEVTLEAALETVLGAPVSGRSPELASAVRSLSFGAVRGFYRHEAILARMLAKPVRSLDPAVRALLSVALFEIEDERTPQYAVVDAAVETAKATDAARAAGLINAVLRRYLRDRAAVDAEIARSPATRHAAPIWLADRLRADWPVRWTQLLAASDARAPMWLRVDSRRATAAQYVERLRAAGIDARAEPKVPQAVVLASPRDVRDLPGFSEGLVSVQDIAAQCVAFALDLAPGLKVLDACAAPGGKTALMAEREPELSRLTAVDVDPKRLARVRENLQRGGLAAQLVHGDAGTPAAWWDGVPYDRILLDAPCSALGVIRRHPDIRLRKSPSDIDKLPALQRRLLEALWPLLAPGGRLVYATCTLTRAENRDVIGAFCASHPEARSVPVEHWRSMGAAWPDLGEPDEFGRQILPGEAGGDGFYYAALTKT